MASHTTSERRLGLFRPNEPRSMSPSPDPSSYVSDPERLFCHWDMQNACIPMFPAFRYISQKLAQRKLYIPLIVSEYGHSIIPAWPISRSAQMFLIKTVRKACSRFHYSSNWMTTMAENSTKQNGKTIFGTQCADPYLIRRSLIQHEVIYGSEGLTLLAIDHVYTFKHLLGMLAGNNWIRSSRETCLSSCIELLRRINIIYTGHKPLQGYFLRAYSDIPIKKEILDEVYNAYNSKYGDSSLVQAPPKGSSQGTKNDSDDSRGVVNPISDSPTFDILNDSFPEAFELAAVMELPKFVAEIDSSSISSWDSDVFGMEDSLAMVTYPKIKSPSPMPALSASSPPLSYNLHRSNAICCRCHTNSTNTQHPGSTKDTTTILSSEWEEFREIGLGLYTASN